jgi:predicted O-methyltransferase YrrM
MTQRTLFLNECLYEYLIATSVRQSQLQRMLSEVTASLPTTGIESSPEQVQLLELLVRLIGAKRCLEIGVFTGYTTLSIALALPEDGTIVACDIDQTATGIARVFWQRAGVDAKIDLRIAPALHTLDGLLADGAAGTFDFAYIDADKGCADSYYERVVQLLGDNRLAAIDNVFWGGGVADPSIDDQNTCAARALNAKLCADPRVDVTFIPLGDGIALVRKRPTLTATSHQRCQ